MDRERNFATIGRQTGVPEQHVQPFMSNSPWPVRAVLAQVHQELAAKPGRATGGLLLLDESADAKAGTKTAGAARQDNGRLGKVDLSQVGVVLAYSTLSPTLEAPVWTWVDGELFLPEGWFRPELAPERQRRGIPAPRPFATKVALGWRMIQRAKAHGLPFEAVGGDDGYGRANWFRRTLAPAAIISMADVPVTTQVSLQPPTVGVPAAPPGHQGRPPSRPRVLSEAKPVSVGAVLDRAETRRQRRCVRTTERGVLDAEFAVRRVWTDRDVPGLPTTEEWLVLCREADGDRNCALSNAPASVTLEDLAWLTCQRYFVERTNQDVKTELGWDDFRAQQYRAWEHHLALTVLASWFLAETKLDWAREAARDPQLARELEVEVLPRLSAAKVRELLRAALPLPHLTPEQATALVVKPLVHRTRARKSRLKHRHRLGSSP